MKKKIIYKAGNEASGNLQQKEEDEESSYVE